MSISVGPWLTSYMDNPMSNKKWCEKKGFSFKFCDQNSNYFASYYKKIMFDCSDHISSDFKFNKQCLRCHNSSRNAE